MEKLDLIKSLWWHNGHLNEEQRDFLIDVLNSLKPEYCIETGFATGRSTVTTLVTAQPKRVVSIDVNLDYMQARSHAMSLMDKFENLKIVEGDSKQILTNDFFEKHFNEGIDFAFVDGSHTYDGAMYDIAAIFPKMRSGAVMVIDDYMSGHPNGCPIPEVDNAVHDFCRLNNLEIERWYMNGKGAAIVRKI